ncbi:Bifunctional polymyxin resistance protein ArnA [Mariniblastus fucicola]|uniref:Bifunctional polymyxin resistance protein ArnA n=2 Tax=Mariniblastus fucicola TaxID=980251 RepID=A0A5B9P5Q8_9BACT|nr:Bifunctional polymyxin resistance protein ArnA [Mariniblastus fucicola]
MKVVCFANNTVGLESVRHLRKAGTEIVALVVHEPAKQKRTTEIIAAANLPQENIFTASQLSDAATLEQIAALKPECGLSAFFGYILKQPTIDLFPRGIVNLHTSLLPLHRGSYPNVWTIVDQTAAGATMHLVDKGVDTGPILAQNQIPLFPDDTGLSLNQRLETAAVELLQSNWSKFVSGELQPLPQDDSLASLHRASDTANIDRIDLDATVRAGDLIDVLRARTFPPHRGAYFEVDGQRYFLELKIEKE